MGKKLKTNNFHQLQSSEPLGLERGKYLGCELRYLSTKFQWYRSHLPGDMGGSDTIGVPSDTGTSRVFIETSYMSNDGKLKYNMIFTHTMVHRLGRVLVMLTCWFVSCLLGMGCDGLVVGREG